MNVPNVELLTNGHMAIELTLQALRLEREAIEKIAKSII